MIDLTESRFIYDGIASCWRGTGKPDLMFANVETERIVTVAGRKNGEFVFNKATKSRYLVSDSYEDSALEMDIDIVTCDGSALSLDDIKDIEKWLFVNSIFKRLSFYPGDFDDEDALWSYFNCRFLYPEKIESDNGIIGFRCTLQTDSRMMWSDAWAGFNFDNEVIVDHESGLEIIKGDANGDGEITSADVQICRAVAAYGRPDPINSTEGHIVPLYSVTDFFDEHGDIIQENEHVLNKIPLPRPITYESLQKCLIACDPNYSQENYDSGVELDFRYIDESYADVIEAKIEAQREQYNPDPGSYITVPILKGDADGDGVVSASDASICLKIATWGTAQYSISDFFDENGNVRSGMSEMLNTLPMPKPITLDSFIRCLVACDLSYKQEDFDQGVELPDIGDVMVDDAQNILKMYVQSVADQVPVETETIDISGGSGASAGIVRVIDVNVNSYTDGYTYPTIHICTGKIGGDIEIENKSDYKEGLFESADRKTVISQTGRNTNISLDSEIKMLTGVEYRKLSKKYFPRLINGHNILYIRGDVASISVEWKNKLYL